MADFETMPIGTRAAMQETAELLRSYERHHLEQAEASDQAASGCASFMRWDQEAFWAEAAARREKADRNAAAAVKLEAILAGVGVYPR